MRMQSWICCRRCQRKRLAQAEIKVHPQEVQYLAGKSPKASRPPTPPPKPKRRAQASSQEQAQGHPSLHVLNTPYRPSSHSASRRDSPRYDEKVDRFKKSCPTFNDSSDPTNWLKDVRKVAASLHFSTEGVVSCIDHVFSKATDTDVKMWYKAQCNMLNVRIRKKEDPDEILEKFVRDLSEQFSVDSRRRQAELKLKS